jgi:predicted ATPase
LKQEANLKPISVGFCKFDGAEYVIHILGKLRGQKEIIVLADEPDMALSPRTCVAIGKLWKLLAIDGCQIICSCHNPILFLSQEEVFNLGLRKWQGAVDYLKSQIGEQPWLK